MAWSSLSRYRSLIIEVRIWNKTVVQWLWCRIWDILKLTWVEYCPQNSRKSVEKENMIEGVSNDAVKLRTVLSRFKSEIKLPFLYGFPHNCCEIVSNLFAELIHDKYPESDIRIVEAWNYIKAESHFWVTVDGYVYDLTSDQFDSFNGPILGVKENPLSEQFNFINSITFQKAVNDFNIVTKEDLLEVINLLKTHLNE